MVRTPKHSWRWACLFRAPELSTSVTVRILAAGISFMVMLLWTRAPVLAHEAISQEEPTKTSVEERVSPIERSFTQEPATPGSFLGQLYGRVKLFEDHFLNLYRYELNTPFINKDDGRIILNYDFSLL